MTDEQGAAGQGVEAEFEPQTERKHWIVQRIGWALLFAGLVLAVLGVFGNGLFTKTTKHASSEGIEVSLQYDRFARMRSPQDIQIRVLAPDAEGDLSVTLANDFLDAVSVREISPDPDSTSVEPGGRTYAWAVEDWSHELVVKFEYSADEWRNIGADIRVDAGEQTQAISFSQFVVP